MSGRTPIKLLVPNLPQAHELMPRLIQIDERRVYTNFGPMVQSFEAALGQFLNRFSLETLDADASVHCVTLGSGTAALELTLMALALPAGAKVLVPSYTFAATALAVLRCGLVPVFSDVDEASWLLTPDLARDALTRQDFGLVLPVATFGCPVDVNAWDSFIEQTGVPVLIDAAAGFGNQAIGRLAPVCFSLHATKPFGVGEGGFMASADPLLVGQVRKLSNFGFEKGQVIQPGTNAKLSEYAAAIGLAQLDRWDALQALRRVRWQDLSLRLRVLPEVVLQDGFGPMDVPSNMVVRCAQVERLRAQCMTDNIETRAWYCPPLHQQIAFRAYTVAPKDGREGLETAQSLGQFTAGLPWHDDLSDSDLDRIVNSLRKATQSL